MVAELAGVEAQQAVSKKVSLKYSHTPAEKVPKKTSIVQDAREGKDERNSLPFLSVGRVKDANQDICTPIQRCGKAPEKKSVVQETRKKKEKITVSSNVTAVRRRTDDRGISTPRYEKVIRGKAEIRETTTSGRKPNEKNQRGKGEPSYTNTNKNRIAKSEASDEKGKASCSINKYEKNQKNLNNQRSKKFNASKKMNQAALNPVESSDDDVNFAFSLIEKKIFEGVGKRRDLAVKKQGKVRGENLKHNVRTKGLRNSNVPNKSLSTKSKEHNYLEKKKNGCTHTPRASEIREHQCTKKHEPSKSPRATEWGREKSSKTKNSGHQTTGKGNRGQSRDTNKKSQSRDPKKQNGDRRKKKNNLAASESDASDWEEVEIEEGKEGVDEAKELLEDCGSKLVIKEEGVRIELDAPELLWGIKRRKRRTEEEMIEDYLRKRVNHSIKEVYENMHKTHLLCLLARGRYVNKALNSEILLAAALSVITDKNAYPPKRLDLEYLQKFVSWFGRKITKKSEDLEKDYWSREVSEALARRFESKSARTNHELVLMFVVICRVMGMNVRLIMALQPLRWKPGVEVLLKKGMKVNEVREKKVKIYEEKEDEFPKPSTSHASKSKQKYRMNEKTGRKMFASDSDPDVSFKKSCKKKKSDKLSPKQKSISDEEEDSEFDTNQMNLKKGPKSLTSQKRKSTEGETEGGRKKWKGEAFVEWAEVYVEEEEKWVCVDITSGKIHCVTEIEAKMPSGSVYITAFNADLSIKDITRRYICSWLSSENKIRCDSKWWGKSLRPFRGQQSRLDREEDMELDQNLRQQPLPKSIGEYKNHPLYALQRHLLKFEAIYPPNVSPVGFLRGEAVYPRESIRNLHSRDTWMKEAKSVRVDEEPYKVVKARPKWDKNTNLVIKDRPLELFGEWQVEDYEPPIAKDGKVPRNDYGNVELFKPTMLPRGCVHLPINGLNKLARKLTIDCAPAMVGFDFHSGWTHPVYDGVVVCEEFKDLLMDAWNQEQVEQAKKAEEKRQKRVYNNWRKLINGMVVRARVREEYKYKEDTDDEEGEAEEKVEKEKKQDIKHNTKKITQEDIDALQEEEDKSRDEEDRNRDESQPKQPTLITHPIRNLKIDLSSNVVEMAKKSRQGTMRSRNSVKKTTVKKKGGGRGKKKTEKSKEEKKNEFTGLSESESDEEEKKEKIRTILSWGTDAVTGNHDLSDDSDAENKPQSSFSPQFSNPIFTSVISPAIEKVQKMKTKRRSKTDTQHTVEESEEYDVSTSRSTTPESDINKLKNTGPRRLSSRHTAKKYSKTYAESGSDISLNSSDCDDRSYNPSKEKKLGYGK